MLGKTEIDVVDRIQPSTHQNYLEAKARQEQNCNEHAELVREFRRKQINTYLGQRLINDLKSMQSQLNPLERIPDDPRPSNKENVAKRKRKIEQPLNFDNQLISKSNF